MDQMSKWHGVRTLARTTVTFYHRDNPVPSCSKFELGTFSTGVSYQMVELIAGLIRGNHRNQPKLLDSSNGTLLIERQSIRRCG